MYQVLAKYYDKLTNDDEAMDLWLKFVNEHHHGNSILELACGSGTLALLLAKNDYDLECSDISKEMLEIAKSKLKDYDVKFNEFNMINIKLDKYYDNIICFCDSINYLIDVNDVEAMFKSVYSHLNDQGVFMFDVHSIDRLEEFKEEFFEEGIIEQHNYEWSITTVDDCLYQQFVFYDENGFPKIENQTQKVYDVQYLTNLLINIGFKINIYTDFNKKGIVEGEKYFFIATKD